MCLYIQCTIFELGGFLVIDRPSMSCGPIVHKHIYVRQCLMASWNSDWRMQEEVDLGPYQVSLCS